MSDPIDCFGLSDRGPVREANEDQFLVADLNKSLLVRQTSLPHPDHTRLFGQVHGHLLAVADGMGGVAGGRRASGLVIQTLTQYVLTTLPYFFRLHDHDAEDLGEELREALDACQKAVAAAAAAEPGHDKMGTTLTLAFVLWPRLYVVHAGDSRAYLRRGGALHRLTRDHTVAERMVADGVMSPEAAKESRWGHVLTNCLAGGRAGVVPDVSKATLYAGDALLLCSDGLGKAVPDERINALLGDGPAEPAARRLVDAAVAAGGKDNITVVVARFPTGEKPAP